MRMRRRRGGPAARVSDERLEEFLELIWTAKEEDRGDLKHILPSSDDVDPAMVLKELEQEGYIHLRLGRVFFTPEGEREAREIIRRHRLAERLFSEVFELPKEDIEDEACKFEHILSPAVTESICTFLGHPPTCPHGKPIPPGPCCTALNRRIEPMVFPLRELGVGEDGRIVFISTPRPARLERLGSLGIAPGSVIRMRQKRPSMVLEVGETTVALDEEVSQGIYVKKV